MTNQSWTYEPKSSAATYVKDSFGAFCFANAERSTFKMRDYRIDVSKGDLDVYVRMGCLGLLMLGRTQVAHFDKKLSRLEVMQYHSLSEMRALGRKLSEMLGTEITVTINDEYLPWDENPKDIGQTMDELLNDKWDQEFTGSFG